MYCNEFATLQKIYSRCRVNVGLFEVLSPKLLTREPYIFVRRFLLNENSLAKIGVRLRAPTWIFQSQYLIPTLHKSSYASAYELFQLKLLHLAHSFVASLVFSRAVLFIQLGQNPRSRLRLHPNTQVSMWYN